MAETTKSRTKRNKTGQHKKNTEMVTQQTTKVSSWKCPGPDRVPVYGVIHY